MRDTRNTLLVAAAPVAVNAVGLAFVGVDLYWVQLGHFLRLTFFV
jgi:hypothetical protein